MSQQSKSELFPGLGLENWSAFGSQAFQPFGAFSEGSFKALAEMNAESYRFVVKRIEEAVRLPSELAVCKSPAEIFEVQAAFVDRMIDDCMGQASKVMAMAPTGAAGTTAKAEATPAPAKPETTPGKTA